MVSAHACVGPGTAGPAEPSGTSANASSACEVLRRNWSREIVGIPVAAAVCAEAVKAIAPASPAPTLQRSWRAVTQSRARSAAAVRPPMRSASAARPVELAFAAAPGPELDSAPSGRCADSSQSRARSTSTVTDPGSSAATSESARTATDVVSASAAASLAQLRPPVRKSRNPPEGHCWSTRSPTTPPGAAPVRARASAPRACVKTFDRSLRAGVELGGRSRSLPSSVAPGETTTRSSSAATRSSPSTSRGSSPRAIASSTSLAAAPAST